MSERDLPIINDRKEAEEAPLTEEQKKRLEEYIEEEEGALNRYKGWLAVVMTALAVIMSLFHLYAAVRIVPAYILRPVHVAFALGLACLPALFIEPRLSPMVVFNTTFKAYNSFILLAVPFFLLTANTADTAVIAIEKLKS